INIKYKGLTPLLIILILVGGRGVVEAEGEGDSLTAYSVSIHIHGDKDPGMKKLLLGVSTAARDVGRPPPTLIMLGAIAESDIKKMEMVLRSKSYYLGTVKYNFKEDKDPPRLIFSIHTGPPFLLNEIIVDISAPPLPEDIIPPNEEATGLKKGRMGTSSSIIAGGERLLSNLRSQGYPFAKINNRRMVVDYSTRWINVTFSLSPGEQAGFGKTIIKGLKDVDEEFVLSKIPWQSGHFYDPALVQEFRNRLSRTGLFTMVFISPLKKESTSPAKPPSSSTPALTGIESEKDITPVLFPVEVTVRERDHHTIGFSGGYSTDLGFGGGVSWENRNLLGEGELLRLNLFASEKMYLVEGRFILPEFFRPDQSLILGIQPVYDSPDAYTSSRVRASAIVRRDISNVFTFSAGAALTNDNVEQLDQTHEFHLLSLPLNTEWSIGGSQPFRRAGALFSFLGEPYWDIKTDRLFVKTLLNTNLLYRFPGDSEISLVGRFSLGSIPEASPGEVPADLRFYAGGANSIRGYAYQIVGPMNGKKPIGGRSLLTFSLEFDVSIIGNFGAAAFLDGGSAFTEILPQPGDDILLGTGIGVRYFTPIGPIGLDIGFPLDKRNGIDDDYQVYVSIAQIF
ncbi:MAG: BamA/TamA family outer membrane protein, partial [Candidatus Auribacterota bacterium]|nr:BamA/TamA family outer membrane protein [Candidatus Auribacterota bacterium]